MQRIRSFNGTIAVTNTAQKLFPIATQQPKVTFIAISVSAGVAFIGGSNVNAASSMGVKIGTAPREFYSESREMISLSDLWISGAAAGVYTVDYLEVY